MGQAHEIERLRNAVENLESIDRQQLFRPNLGEESLEGVLKPKFEELLADARFALEYSSGVADSQIQSAVSLFEQFYQVFVNHVNLQSADYIAQKNNLLTNINSLRDQFLNCSPYFVAAAVKSRGFLEDEGIRTQYNKTMEDLKRKSDETLGAVEKKSQEILEGAKSIADEIEQRAKRTAARVSVEEVQKQFQEAQGHHEKQVKLWCWISGGSGAAFIAFVILLWIIGLDAQGGWQPFYYSALRIALLGAVGAFHVFCLKTLRAHMHMRERNLHRQRIANSIPSFVDSVVNHDQRDMILAQLVDAVAAFGSSGLLGARDDLGSPTKLAVDSVLRSITPPGTKN